MRRRELRLICTLLLTASTACSALGGPQAQSSGPIKIGMVTSLTGNYAPLGTNDKLAAQQVIDGVNNKGGINGRKIDLEIVDDGSDPNQSVIQFNKVIGDGVVARHRVGVFRVVQHRELGLALALDEVHARRGHLA